MDEGDFAALGFVRTEDETTIVVSKPVSSDGFVLVKGDAYINGAAGVTGNIIVGGDATTGIKSVAYFCTKIDSIGATNDQAATITMPFGGFLKAWYGVIWGAVGVAAGNGGTLRLVHDAVSGVTTINTAKPDFDMVIPDGALIGTPFPVVVLDTSYLHFEEGDNIRIQVADATANAVAISLVFEVYKTQR